MIDKDVAGREGEGGAKAGDVDGGQQQHPIVRRPQEKPSLLRHLQINAVAPYTVEPEAKLASHIPRRYAEVGIRVLPTGIPWADTRRCCRGDWSHRRASCRRG